jgi:hypothetical protein
MPAAACIFSRPLARSSLMRARCAVVLRSGAIARSWRHSSSMRAFF